MHPNPTETSAALPSEIRRQPPNPKPRLERALTVAGMLVTLAATVMALRSYGVLAFGSDQPLALRIEIGFFVCILLWLLCGNLVFQATRLVYWGRLRKHRPPTRLELEAIYDGPAPSVCILVPSYREEFRVLRQTVLSAALAEYPDRRIVVLLDDPPRGTRSEMQALQASRALIEDLNRRLAEQAQCIETALAAMPVAADPRAEAAVLAACYDEIADWLEAEASEQERTSPPAFAHTDLLFAERILREPAAAHRHLAAGLRLNPTDRIELNHHRRRLAALFRVGIESFERKQYETLPHAANKAMNLNAYIGLMGGDWRAVETAAGQAQLERCEPASATIRAPSADFLLVLDADSLVLSDYLLKLVPVIDADPRMAVIGSPYTAVPRARTALERVAGATTDVHFCVHQGLTGFGANFWVGACAMVRLEALRDIQKTMQERGHHVPVFISDRTVIEDTEASIDLVRAGWTLHSYPERLSYSATPADFGALIIQRRRWANGGLLIMPELLRHQRRRRWTARGLAEFAMRSYYLGALPFMTLAMIALLTYPFSDALTSAWLPAAAVPYYYLYGRDLRHCGYRWSDLLRGQALNLVLLPVSLQGVLASISQGLTGRKAAFGRTPKIGDRTGMPAMHALAQWAILVFIGNVLVADLASARYLHACFALMNEAFFLYGFLAFVGARESWQDVSVAFLARAQALGPPAHGALTRLSLALRISVGDRLKRTALITPEATVIVPTAQGAEGQ